MWRGVSVQCDADSQARIAKSRQVTQTSSASAGSACASAGSALLRHPIYAGAYVYGLVPAERRRAFWAGFLRASRRVGMDEWQVLILDKVPAYITWEQWERNQNKLRENSTRFGCGSARGASILAGRIACGKCKASMSVQYRDGIPFFCCRLANLQHGGSNCLAFNGRWLEPMIEELVLQALEPASVQLSLRAADDIEDDRAGLEKYHTQSVERARYHADLARRRYEEVDPSNRLVAADLEKRWEAALVDQRKSEEALNRFRQETPTSLTQDERRKIESLANDFRSLWTNERTSNKDRQDLVRILIERIVVEIINGTERMSVTVHWAGGFTSHHEARRTVSTFDELEESEALLKRAQELYDAGCPQAELVQRLNGEGFRPARNAEFTKTNINALIRVLREKGVIGSSPKVARPFWRSKELSSKLGIKPSTLSGWRRRGWVQVTKLGRRWIYWADDADLARLKKLATHPPSGSTPVPEELTIPAAIMPAKTT